MPINYYNPFSDLVETQQYPTARIVRTTFWQKMKDTFSVLAGDLGVADPDKETRRAGVFDYATLFIPRLIQSPFTGGYVMLEEWLLVALS